jgi:hypothetical protein
MHACVDHAVWFIAYVKVTDLSPEKSPNEYAHGQTLTCPYPAAQQITHPAEPLKWVSSNP